MSDISIFLYKIDFIKFFKFILKKYNKRLDKLKQMLYTI
ncbi:hypothetical protein HMPREF9127_1502 [Parvimonas sp. oral taxon 393 str. F0440]|nr:hypothetical protein HMPREF9127_1502 [Parvimonas sp. oral taxon 393 str. F0440]